MNPSSPFRLQGTQYEGQIAAIGVGLLHAQHAHFTMHAGVCGCPESLQSNAIIISDHASARCVFCGRMVELTPLFTHQEVLAWQTVLRSSNR